MTDSLLSLVERLEKLSGPDHEMDKAVAQAIGWHVAAEPTSKGYRFSRRETVLPMTEFLPRFTESIDAAMTLVPEGCGWTLDNFGEANVYELTPREGQHGLRIIGSCDPSRGESKPPAIALLIAIFRARLSLSHKEVKNERR